jgi:hypothetical protein
LIGEFQNYLGILKAVHSGAPQPAARVCARQAARSRVPVRWSERRCLFVRPCATSNAPLLPCTGADLQASAANVGSTLPGNARPYLGYVTTHIGDSQVSGAAVRLPVCGRGRGGRAARQLVRLCSARCWHWDWLPVQYIPITCPSHVLLTAAMQVLPFIEAAVAARTEIQPALPGNR